MEYELKTQEDLLKELQQKNLNLKLMQQQQKKQFKKPLSINEKISMIEFENRNFYKYGVVKNDRDLFNTEFNGKGFEVCFFKDIAINEKSINGFKYVIDNNNKNLIHTDLLNNNLEDNEKFFNSEYADFLNLFNKKKYKKNELKQEIELFIKYFKKRFYNEFRFNNEFLNFITYKTTTEREQNKKQKILSLILRKMLKSKTALKNYKKRKEKVFYSVGLRGEDLRNILNNKTRSITFNKDNKEYKNIRKNLNFNISDGELKDNDFNTNNSMSYYINFKNGKKVLLISSYFSLLNFEQVVLKCQKDILKYFNCEVIKEDNENLFICYTEKTENTEIKHNLVLNRNSFNLFINNLINEGFISRDVIYSKHNKRNSHKHINLCSWKLVKRHYKIDVYTLKLHKKREIKRLSTLDILKTLEQKPTEKTTTTENNLICVKCKKEFKVYLMDKNFKLENIKLCENCNKEKTTEIKLIDFSKFKPTIEDLKTLNLA